MTPLFRVIDMRTGQEPDLQQIALTEPWAQYLTYCDIQGFAIQDDGNLVLLDEYGNYVAPPRGRFRVEWNK